TLATVKTFLGLSSDRAYKRYYPAIDPLISWSRYLDQMSAWYRDNISADWVDDVKAAHELLHRGDAIYQMMQVTGEEGITVEDFVTWQKSVFLDMVYLQQDAYDPVDTSMPLDRQKRSFELVKQIIEADYAIDARDEARDFFTRLINLYKNMNYSPDDSAEYDRYLREIRQTVESRRVKPAEDNDTGVASAQATNRAAEE
ncbi:MAG: hypothetical protein PVI01_14735, partial [Gemmatimonadales bacterium]